jgi:hypothetical protein
MATPTYAEVIEQINTYIVANGNNEITANVLNPILKILADFSNNTIGNLEDLTTDENDTIVDALNSLVQNISDINNNGVKLFTGNDNPNTTPPSNYDYADFYMQVDSIDSTPIQLWQWDGFEWSQVGSFINQSDYRAEFNLNINPKVFEIPENTLLFGVYLNNTPLDFFYWSKNSESITITYPDFDPNGLDKISIIGSTQQ